MKNPNLYLFGGQGGNTPRPIGSTGFRGLGTVSGVAALAALAGGLYAPLVTADSGYGLVMNCTLATRISSTQDKFKASTPKLYEIPFLGQVASASSGIASNNTVSSVSVDWGDGSYTVTYANANSGTTPSTVLFSITDTQVQALDVNDLATFALLQSAQTQGQSVEAEVADDGFSMSGYLEVCLPMKGPLLPSIGLYSGILTGRGVGATQFCFQRDLGAGRYGVRALKFTNGQNYNALVQGVGISFPTGGSYGNAANQAICFSACSGMKLLSPYGAYGLAMASINGNHCIVLDPVCNNNLDGILWSYNGTNPNSGDTTIRGMIGGHYRAMLAVDAAQGIDSSSISDSNCAQTPWLMVKKAATPGTATIANMMSSSLVRNVRNEAAGNGFHYDYNAAAAIAAGTSYSNGAFLNVTWEGKCGSSLNESFSGGGRPYAITGIANVASIVSGSWAGTRVVGNDSYILGLSEDTYTATGATSGTPVLKAIVWVPPGSYLGNNDWGAAGGILTEFMGTNGVLAFSSGTVGAPTPGVSDMRNIFIDPNGQFGGMFAIQQSGGAPVAGTIMATYDESGKVDSAGAGKVVRGVVLTPAPTSGAIMALATWGVVPVGKIGGTGTPTPSRGGPFYSSQGTYGLCTTSGPGGKIGTSTAGTVSVVGTGTLQCASVLLDAGFVGALM